MVKKIVYTDSEGNFVIKSIDSRTSTDSYLNYYHSKGFTDVAILDSENFPSDYQDAWELSGSTISVNMTKAKNIKRERLRAERDRHLRNICDGLYIEAISSRKDPTDIKARQKYLRDMPENPLIDSAATVEELNAIVIDESWVPPEVKTLEEEIKLHKLEDEIETSTTSRKYKRRNRMTFDTKSGDYLITFTAEIRNTNKKGKCKTQVKLDDVEISKTSGNPDPAELEYSTISSTSVKTLTEGTHTLDVNYATTKGACFIRRVRLQALKIETG